MPEATGCCRCFDHHSRTHSLSRSPAQSRASTVFVSGLRTRMRKRTSTIHKLTAATSVCGLGWVRLSALSSQLWTLIPTQPPGVPDGRHLAAVIRHECRDHELLETGEDLQHHDDVKRNGRPIS